MKSAPRLLALVLMTLATTQVVFAKRAPGYVAPPYAYRVYCSVLALALVTLVLGAMSYFSMKRLDSGYCRPEGLLPVIRGAHIRREHPSSGDR